MKNLTKFKEISKSMIIGITFSFIIQLVFNKLNSMLMDMEWDINFIVIFAVGSAFGWIYYKVILKRNDFVRTIENFKKCALQASFLSIIMIFGGIGCFAEARKGPLPAQLSIV